MIIEIHRKTYRYQPILIFGSVPSWIVLTNSIAGKTLSQLIVHVRLHVFFMLCSGRTGRRFRARQRMIGYSAPSPIRVGYWRFFLVIGNGPRCRGTRRPTDDVEHELGVLLSQFATVPASIAPGGQAIDDCKNEQHNDEHAYNQQVENDERAVLQPNFVTGGKRQKKSEQCHKRNASIPPAILATEKLAILGKLIRHARFLIEPLPQSQKKATSRIPPVANQLEAGMSLPRSIILSPHFDP